MSQTPHVTPTYWYVWCDEAGAQEKHPDQVKILPAQDHFSLYIRHLSLIDSFHLVLVADPPPISGAPGCANCSRLVGRNSKQWQPGQWPGPAECHSLWQAGRAGSSDQAMGYQAGQLCSCGAREGFYAVCTMHHWVNDSQ